MAFPAKYPGYCVVCERGIREGDPIEITDDGTMHEDCVDDLRPTAPQPVCTKCWLTHPEGKCDR